MKTFTEHINMLFEKGRLYIQTMDHSHISIFELILPSEWFDLYEHKCDASFKLGINSSILYKVLNSRDKTQQINIVYNENNEDILEIHFTPISETIHAEFDKHFEISLLNIDNEIMDIPIIEYQAEITIASFNFANMINQLKMFSDNLDLICSEEKIVLYSNSLEQGKMFVEIKIDDLSSFIIDEGKTINMSFSLTQIHNICLYNKMSKEVDVKFKDNYPMKLIYNLVGHPDAQIRFYLAPKINEN
jgi:proliferating cell nuclear antigen PCNA